MNPNNNFSNNNKNNNKMPKFNMGWIYGLCIIGLIIAFIMGGNSTGGSAGKQLAYSDFQTYVAKGYAESIVVNKDNGKLKMFVKPNYIRTVFNAGTKQMGPNPFVEVQYGSVDKLEGFIDAARAQGVFKGEAAVSDEVEILEARGVLVEDLPDAKGPMVCCKTDELKSLAVSSRNVLKQLGLDKAELKRTTPLKFACRCSPDRAVAMLAALSEEERKSLPPTIDITCHMCGKTFTVKV